MGAETRLSIVCSATCVQIWCKVRQTGECTFCIYSIPNHARILVLSAVAVAQLVESRIVIPVVVGSSPISHPIKSLAYKRFNLCQW